MSLVVCGTLSAYGHIPVVLEKQQGLSSTPLQIRDTTTSMAYYDTIYDVPRYYVVTATSSGEFYINLTIPKISSTPQCTPTVIITDSKNQLIYESIGNKITWTDFHEPFGNADYFRGAEAKIYLIPGVYSIEVSSETQNCKYVLATGVIEKFEFADMLSSVYLIPIINQNFFAMNSVQSIMNLSGFFMLFVGLFASLVIFITIKVIKRIRN